MFTPSATTTYFSATDAGHIGGPGRRQRTIQRRIGVLAAGALLAATLSAALPIQLHAVTQPGGNSTAAHSTGQLSPTADGITDAASSIVTKGQKG